MGSNAQLSIPLKFGFAQSKKGNLLKSLWPSNNLSLLAHTIGAYRDLHPNSNPTQTYDIFLKSS